MTALLVQFTVDIIIPSIALLVNTVACVTARRLLASPPLHTRKPPPTGIIYREPLPGEVGTNAGPEDQSKYFVAVNTTNLNKTIGYINYSVVPGNRAQEELDFFPLPHIRRDAEIVLVDYIRVGWKSRKRGVGTWMLSNFLTHVKNKRPQLDAVYLMVAKDHIARRMYENVGFKELKGGRDKPRRAHQTSSLYASCNPEALPDTARKLQTDCPDPLEKSLTNHHVDHLKSSRLEQWTSWCLGVDADLATLGIGTNRSALAYYQYAYTTAAAAAAAPPHEHPPSEDVNPQ